MVADQGNGNIIPRLSFCNWLSPSANSRWESDGVPGDGRVKNKADSGQAKTQRELKLVKCSSSAMWIVDEMWLVWEFTCLLLQGQITHERIPRANSNHNHLWYKHNHINQLRGPIINYIQEHLSRAALCHVFILHNTTTVVLAPCRISSFKSHTSVHIHWRCYHENVSWGN